ncbi:MAG TPA: RNA polymerase sigma-70 factor [Bacteroidales bacterium]|nr:RNA polymerase sigma-70 factor [Rikenellaceae bacterium]HON54281.1 RNA polymerase sigma-70 factor [Bacteroidales bacterium]HRR48860.1 RNA polymerase sigma-70 factor [Bacteroidales bacterium]HRT33718.1 RNA polymerase sigma-70 factor [Bacteroidales bacterium]HRT83500.1 RNA polymerase sigma-70 factor [Bacteroidales bacterium]
MLQDLLLVKRIKEGDIAAFEQLFKSSYMSLLYYSISITGSKEISEEIIQELFYYIWKERDKLQIMSSLKGYLYKSVKNRSIQYLHSKCFNMQFKSSSEVEMNTGEDGESNMELKDLENVILKSMEMMPIRRAQIFRMHRFDKMSYSEIAEKLSLSIKTIEAEIGKALKTLRREVKKYND